MTQAAPQNPDTKVGTELGGWRPIETAPRDRQILLYIPGKGAIEGWWFSSPKEIDDGWETIVGFWGDPTGWTELPDEP